MKHIQTLFCITSLFCISAQQIRADTQKLVAHLFQLIANAGPTEECVEICEQLKHDPTVNERQRRTIAAHALARSYHQLVRLNKKNRSFIQERNFSLVVLSISGYFLGSVFANRLWNSGLGKKSRSAWFWFPLARVCSLDEDNHTAMSIGLGLFWAQLILSPLFGLAGIYYGISTGTIYQRKIKTVKAKQDNLKILITQLEEIYYESRS